MEDRYDGSPSARSSQTHDVLRDAGAAGHRSPGAQPDRAADRSALQRSRSGRVRGHVAVPRNRRCGSSTAIYASQSDCQPTLQNPGTFDLAQHKGRYVAVLLWCLPHAKLLLSCCAFEFLTFYGAATRYSASSSIGNSSGDAGRWPVASVRSPRSIDIGLSSNSKFRAGFSQLPVHMASSIVHRVGVSASLATEMYSGHEQRARYTAASALLPKASAARGNISSFTMQSAHPYTR